jgi:signal transduction histidine kinase
VIESIPAMAWTARPDGSYEFVNRRWAEYTGLSAEDTIGSGWRLPFIPRIVSRFWTSGAPPLLMANRSNGRPAFVPLRMGNIAGFWLVVCRCAMSKERLSGGTEFLRHRRSQAAEAERERLRELEADLAHINRVSMMGELAASIAHEVNQPLTGIVSNGSACLRFLTGDAPNLEEARDPVRDIVRDGKRADEVIARIRALTKKDCAA